MEWKKYTIQPMADLRGANLRRADLQGADLQEANLRGAYLQGADLQKVNLQGANLYMAYIDISMALKAFWRNPSPHLCLELMRLDYELLPDGRALFAKWKKTGDCPFSGYVQRSYIFHDQVYLWTYARPKPLWKIWQMVCKEYKIKFKQK